MGLTGGHALHGDMAPDQLLFLRPARGWADYRTPIRGLYLCGAGTHPGGGVTGANGRNAASEVLRDAKRSGRQQSDGRVTKGARAMGTQRRTQGGSGVGRRDFLKMGVASAALAGLSGVAGSGTAVAAEPEQPAGLGAPGAKGVLPGPGPGGAGAGAPARLHLQDVRLVRLGDVRRVRDPADPRRDGRVRGARRRLSGSFGTTSSVTPTTSRAGASWATPSPRGTRARRDARPRSWSTTTPTCSSTTSR